MSALQWAVESPLLWSLGIGLLHSLWISAALATGLWMVLHFMHRPQMRYIAACCTLGAMTLSLFGALAIFAARANDHRGEYRDSRAPPASFTQVLPAALDGQPDRSPVRSHASKPDSPAPQEPNSWIPWPLLERLISAFAAMWLLCAFIRTLWVGGACLSVERLHRAGTRPASPEWRTRVAELASRMGVRRPVQLLESERLTVPVAFRHFRPLILMPAALATDLSPSQIEALLLHELAHIRRHDWAAKVLQSLADAVLFMHPGARWVSQQITLEREVCCDELAAACLGKRRDYAEALIVLEQTRTGISAGFAVSAADGKLATRIERLVHPAGPSHPAGGRPAALVLLTVLVAGFALGYYIGRRIPDAYPEVLEEELAGSTPGNRRNDGSPEAAAADSATPQPPVVVSPPQTPIAAVAYSTEDAVREVRMPKNNSLTLLGRFEPGQDSDDTWIRTSGEGYFGVHIIPRNDGLWPFVEARWKDADGEEYSDADSGAARGSTPYLTVPQFGPPENWMRLNVYARNKFLDPEPGQLLAGEYLIHIRRLVSPSDHDADTLGPESSLLRLDAAGRAQVPSHDDRAPPAIDHPGDIDVFQIPTPTAGRLTINITADEVNPGLNLNARLYAAGGDLVQQSRNALGRQQALTQSTNQGDVHYLALTSYDNESTGPYTLDVRHVSGREAEKTQNRP